MRFGRLVPPPRLNARNLRSVVGPAIGAVQQLHVLTYFVLTLGVLSPEAQIPRIAHAARQLPREDLWIQRFIHGWLAPLLRAIGTPDFGHMAPAHSGIWHPPKPIAYPIVLAAIFCRLLQEQLWIVLEQTRASLEGHERRGSTA